MRHVPISVAIVMPDIGLLLDPTRPTMRLATVTKKNPKIITNTPIKSRWKTPSPGMFGRTAVSAINIRLPIITTLKERSCSVRATLAVPFSFSDETLSRNELMIVGIVFINVMNPPAATAPAPICFI